MIMFRFDKIIDKVKLDAVLEQVHFYYMKVFTQTKKHLNYLRLKLSSEFDMFNTFFISSIFPLKRFHINWRFSS